MARTLSGRLHATATLEAQTALHVGAAGSDGVVADLVVAHDGAGRAILPGSSLAGVLRVASWHAVRACADPDAEAAWAGAWGSRTFALDESRAEQANADASLLAVADAVAIGSAATEIRDHVGIDRRTGTAADGIRYDRLVIAGGTRFALRLTLDVPRSDPGNGYLRLLDLLLRALAEGTVRIGAATSRGLGRLKATSTTIGYEALDGREAILSALASRTRARRAPDQLAAPSTAELDARSVEEHRIELTTDATARVSIAWHPASSVLVRDGRPGDGVDGLPLTTAVRDGRRTFVLPGSSVKGALRSAAERIVRTAIGVRAAALDEDHPHHEQVDVAVVSLLFGAAKRRSADGTSHARRGALALADCHAIGSFEHKSWQAAHTGETPTAVQRDLRKAGGPLEDVAAVTHVALDRWTGGAADQRLFSVLEPRGVAWPPLELEIDTTRLAGDAYAVGALLVLVLRELQAGDLPLGGMTSRGHGAIVCDTFTVAGAGRLGIPDGAFDPLSFDVPEAVVQAWKAALTAARSAS